MPIQFLFFLLLPFSFWVQPHHRPPNCFTFSVLFQTIEFTPLCPAVGNTRALSLTTIFLGPGVASSSQQESRDVSVPQPSVENWIKDLLSMGLPTTARLSCLHSQSFPSGSLHKPLTLIHQRADGRSKSYNPTASRTNITLAVKLSRMITEMTALSNSIKL